jgi:triosephosphate isomerase
MSRKFIVGGNWKMNGTKSSIASLVNALNDATRAENVEVFVAPPSPYLVQVLATAQHYIQVAAQNCHKEAKGAFTGEISPQMLADLGVPYAILGHSERRNIFGESVTLVAEKVKAALAAGLRVVVCCGELLSERESGKTLEIVRAQLEPLLTLNPQDWSRIVVAYEPVWAIGTGVTATPQQAQETQHAIRSWMRTAAPPGVADSLRIQYGGSVNAKNCDELAQQPDIDGFLVGGASLIAADFLAIVRSGSQKH